MAQQLRAIKRRIGSVKSTQKITSAMELIASSRVVKARQRVNAARPYAEEMRRLMSSVAANAGSIDHPLLSPRDEVTRVGTIVLSSDRGLAGAYNSNVLRRASRLIGELRDNGHDIALYQVGRKGEGFFKYRGETFTETWFGVTDKPTYDDAVDIGDRAMRDYREGEIDELRLVYTDFRSAITQVPTAVRLLPVEPRSFRGGQAYPPQFMFEPTPDEILERLLPRYIEHRIYAALLESAASEHASRQRAMKAASDNAEEIVDNLTREANQARQAAITTEISEIVGGAEALAGG